MQQSHISRRGMLFLFAAGFALPATRSLAAPATFYHNAGCGCCHAWSQRMAESGFDLQLAGTDDLQQEYARHGVPQGLEGCHVGRIEGYVISGHVPPQDVKRLLVERPNASGLIVPGMPMGSPGMENGSETETYEVLLLNGDGSTSVFSTYG